MKPYSFECGDRVVLLTPTGQPHGRVLTQHREMSRNWYGVMLDSGSYFTPFEEALASESPLESLARLSSK